MSKYNNGHPMPLPDTPDEIDTAIKEWSEGNAHLANAIRACIKNGLPTFASCKGHKYTIRGSSEKIGKRFNPYPYLAISITDENIGKIANIVNVLSQCKYIKILLTINNAMKEHFAIYAQIINRFEVFDIIAESAKKSIDLDDANDFTKEIIKLYSLLKVYGIRCGIEEFDIYFATNENSKNIFFTFLCKNPSLNRIFDEMRILNGYSNDISLDKLKRLNELLHAEFTGSKLPVDGANKNFIRIINSSSAIRGKNEENEKSEKETWKKIEEEIGIVLGTGEIPDFINDATRRFRKVSESMGIHTNYFKNNFFTPDLLKITLSKQQIKELAEDFLFSLGIDYSTVAKISERAARLKAKSDINKNKESNEEPEIVSIDYSKSHEMTEDSRNNENLDSIRNSEISTLIDTEIATSEEGTIKDVYELINQMSRVMCIKNGLSTIPTISSEVVAQCLRRMLDEYLLCKTNTNQTFYGLNYFDLKRDIQNRRIEEIITGLKSSSKLVNGEFSGLQEEAELGSRIISLILSSKFFTFKKQERSGKIFELIRIANTGNRNIRFR